MNLHEMFFTCAVGFLFFTFIFTFARERALEPLRSFASPGKSALLSHFFNLQFCPYPTTDTDTDNMKKRLHRRASCCATSVTTNASNVVTATVLASSVIKSSRKELG